VQVVVCPSDDDTEYHSYAPTDAIAELDRCQFICSSNSLSNVRMCLEGPE